MNYDKILHSFIDKVKSFPPAEIGVGVKQSYNNTNGATIGSPLLPKPGSRSKGKQSKLQTSNNITSALLDSTWP